MSIGYEYDLIFSYIYGEAIMYKWNIWIECYKPVFCI
jgi:hypothetical protein